MEEWGGIHNPTIESLVRMTQKLWDEGKEEGKPRRGNWSDIRIWKMDFKGAFTLLTFNLDEVESVGLRLTKEVIMLFLCGVFGWTGTPAAFNVVTKAVLWELHQEGVLQGYVDMFVDDIIGVAWAWDVVKDMNIARELCRKLMGPNSMELSKEFVGVKADVIGYTIDLETQMVGVKESNALRSLYGFLMIDVDKPVTRKLMERLASWASRYAVICVYLLPFKKTLYHEYQGRVHPWVISEECKLVVRVFRALLLGLETDTKYFGRTIESFRDPNVSKCSVIAEHDASLQGVGCSWYTVDEYGIETLVGYSSWNISCLGYGTDSSYQNTAEFVSGILALMGIVVLGLPRDAVKLRGDSKSSLSWTHARKFRSINAQPAAVVFIIFLSLSGMKLLEPEFLSGENNWRCDELSRWNRMEELTKRDPRYKSAINAEWDSSEFLGLVGLQQQWKKEQELVAFWSKATTLVKKLLKENE